MKENLTYGECLSEILFALNIKASWLAREISIDSSLIYKWMRNERVPPYGSPYINLILKCIAKKLSNPSSKKAMIEVLNSFEFDVSETNDTHILTLLQSILESSQEHSITMHKKAKKQHRLFTARISSVVDFIENIDARSTNSSNTYNTTEEHNFNDLINEESLSACHDQVQIIQGNSQILYSALSLLRQAPKSPKPGESILITLNGNGHLLHCEKALSSYLVKTLSELLGNGWNIFLLLKLDGNANRTIKIIEDIQGLLATGNLKIYYYKNPVASDTVSELFIVPEAGVLLGFSACTKNQIDSAFLFRSKTSIELLTSNYFQYLVSSKPLLKSYPSQFSAEIQKEFAECEEMPGNKYVFKDGLSTITMPADLYEKYLNLESEANCDLTYRLFLHKKRLDAFKLQIMHFEFKDICFIESIEELVENRKYSSDEDYLLRGNKPSGSDIVRHLENVIDLLQTYKNYEIAFVSKEHYKRMANINWMVKGNGGVLIEAFNKSLQPNYEVNFLITEKSTVSAFYDYFMILWKNIPDENKNKSNSIAWLRLLIEECEQSSDFETDKKK